MMNGSFGLKNIAIWLIFVLSMLGILFINWFVGHSFVICIIPIGTIFLMILDYKRIQIDYLMIFLLFLLICLVCVNLFLFQNNHYLFDALVKGTILPLFVGIYFLKLKDYDHLEEKIFNPLFIFLNLYCFFNFFIMLKQVSTPGFMVHNRGINTFYVDMITGLIGENGTHKLSFLFIGTLYLNYYYFQDLRKSVRVMAKFFFWFVLLTSLYISAFNDNRMYYFLVLFSLLPIFFIRIKQGKISKKKILHRGIGLLFAVLIVVSFYQFHLGFRSFVQDHIIDNYLQKTVNRFSVSTSDSYGKGEERLELFKYSLSHTNLLIGNGIGSIHMTRDVSVPKHFGINDIIVRIYTGGIFYAILILLIYMRFYSLMFGKKNLFYTIFISLFVVLSAFYTQSFSQIDKTFLISYALFMIYQVSYRYLGKEKE